jgi:hypothetical protein
VERVGGGMHAPTVGGDANRRLTDA